MLRTSLTPHAHHLPPPSPPPSKSLDLDVEVETLDSGIPLRSSALLDSGAEGLFLDAEWVHSNNISTKQLRTLIPVFNVDRTPNEAGMITEVTDLLLRHKGHTERALFAITKLGPQTMILGFSWLEKHKSTGKQGQCRCLAARNLVGPAERHSAQKDRTKSKQRNASMLVGVALSRF